MKKHLEYTSSGRRYFGLTASITIFLLIIVSLLALNYYANRKLAENTAVINTTGQMKDQIQSITRDLFDMKLSFGEDPNSPHITGAVKRIMANTQAFSTNINLLTHGGEIASSNATISISPVSYAGVDEQIAYITEEWEAFRKTLVDYSKQALTLQATETPIDLAINQAQGSSLIIYNEVQKLANRLYRDVTWQNRMIEYAQIFGVAITIIYFLIFIFFFVKRLKRSDKEIAQVRQENTEIMQTIQEGLFLVNEDLQIGQQTSNKLASLFPEQKFSGEQMDSVLAGLVDAQNIDNTRRFIKQLFNERIDEQLIEDLNPLQKISVHIVHDDRPELRYVRFIFTRVWEDDHIKRVLVSVNDITKAVELERRLEIERKQNEQQIELLVKVLQISPPLLASFLRNARHLTNHVNDVLRGPDDDVKGLKNKAREIFRDVHSFKGESAALGLDHFVDSCEHIEDCLKELQNKQKITGNDFMPVTVALDDLIERIQSIENLQANMKQIMLDNQDSNVNDINQYYSQFAQEVAARNQKLVNLEITHYDADGMDDDTHDQVKEIIVQLIRNAVVHGVESSETRQSRHKSSTGLLTLSLNKTGDGYRLDFSDDGAGINYDALRNKIKQQEKYAQHPEQVDQMQPTELNRFIFMSGVSTAAHSNSDAGRGMGMDVIKDRLRALDAQIALRSQPQQGTRFAISIPKSQQGGA